MYLIYKQSQLMLNGKKLQAFPLKNIKMPTIIIIT